LLLNVEDLYCVVLNVVLLVSGMFGANFLWFCLCARSCFGILSHPVFDVEGIYFMTAEECLKAALSKWTLGFCIKRAYKFSGCLAEEDMHGPR